MVILLKMLISLDSQKMMPVFHYKSVSKPSTDYVDLISAKANKAARELVLEEGVDKDVAIATAVAAATAVFNEVSAANFQVLEGYLPTRAIYEHLGLPLCEAVGLLNKMFHAMLE